MFTIVTYFRPSLDDSFTEQGRFQAETTDEVERFCERFLVKPGRAVTILDENGNEVDL